MLNIKLPKEVTKRFTVKAPSGYPEASLPCFAVKIRRRKSLPRPLQFALISQADTLELLTHSGSLALWQGGSGTKPVIYFKLKGEPASSVNVGRWLLKCAVGDTCHHADKNYLNFLRSNLQRVDCGYCKSPAREPTHNRLKKLEKVTPQPIFWSDYLVGPEAIDLASFTYKDHV